MKPDGSFRLDLDYFAFHYSPDNTLSPKFSEAMGKPPRECGIRPQRITQVAFHPRALVVAIGYADGLVLLCRLGDAAEILVHTAEPGDGAISALAWDKTGARLRLRGKSSNDRCRNCAEQRSFCIRI